MHARITRPVLIAAAVVVLLLVPIPVHGRWIRAVLNVGHVVIGAVLAYAAWLAIRPRTGGSDLRVAVIVFCVASAAGLAIEFAQALTGREMSWGDAVTNSAGAAAILLIAGGWRTHRKAMIAAGVVVGCVGCLGPGRIVWDAIRQYRDAPLMASFEDDLELTRWTFLESSGRRVPEHATHGDHSLAVALGPGRYPGASLVAPLADWTGYGSFLFDVHVDDGPPIELILKVEDHQHDRTTYVHEDRFHAYFELGPGLHQLDVPIETVRAGPKTRLLEIDDVKTVQWFVDGLKTERTIHIDNVRLR